MATTSLPPGVSRKWPVAVLGATGAVGQTFIRLLASHPWFNITELAASERTAGKKYRDAAKWIEGTMPDAIADLTIRNSNPSEVTAPIVFSALDASAAGEIEPMFASSGRLVLSNAKNFRMEPDVPLVIPEVNGSHLALLEIQRKTRGWPAGGGIVTNANCAATVIAMAAAPLHEEFEITALAVTTMQAISGAGYPGVASLDILGNMIPFISGEEEKIEREVGKMLGRYDAGRIQHAAFPVSAHANRIHVRHGHSACMSLNMRRQPTVEEAVQAMQKWRGDERCRELPSAPVRALYVLRDDDRPQPARDVDAGAGMTVSVGRVRGDSLFHLRMIALGHNTIRGAAGGSVLNAELMARTGQLPGPM